MTIFQSYGTPPEIISNLFCRIFWQKMKEAYQVNYVANLIRFAKFRHFHFIICLYRKYGLAEALEFDDSLFQALAKHKNKIYFEFVLMENGGFKLNGIIYNEKPDRMGLIIKKSILKAFIERGYNIKYLEKRSKVNGISFFDLA